MKRIKLLGYVLIALADALACRIVRRLLRTGLYDLVVLDRVDKMVVESAESTLRAAVSR